MARSVAVLAASLAAPGVFLSGCGSSGGETSTTASTSTESTTTTTTTPSNGECENTVWNTDWRPNAEYDNNTEALAATSIDDCCQACQTDDKCVSWVWFSRETSCHVILDNAVWAGVIPATDYTFGSKNRGQCAAENCDNCGHNSQDVDDTDVRCAECVGNETWWQYPCFLEKTCKCGGNPKPFSTSTSAQPSTGPTSGPSDEDYLWDFEELI
jgi:hypothetical protein